MKKNLRGKIREFIHSEEGKVGVKSPLTLGAAMGSVLLAQAVVGPTAQAVVTCNGPNDCQPGGDCVDIECVPTGNGGQTCWGVCSWG